MKENYKVPPAWINIKIYPKSSNIYCTGYDSIGRKQYIYKHSYVKKKTKQKFCNLIDFSKKLPKIIKTINKNITKKWSKDKIIALILKIMIHCNFRIGNEIYKKKYNSFGLTTLQNNHITFINNKIKIKFIGKKGVLNKCVITDPLIINNMPKKKSKYYFSYNKQNIKATDINIFIKKFGTFSSKDFRTWSANIIILNKLQKSKNYKTDKLRKKNIKKIIEQTAKDLHHTPAICKKSYIHPKLVDLYILHPIKFKKFMNNKTLNDSLIQILKSFC